MHGHRYAWRHEPWLGLPTHARAVDLGRLWRADRRPEHQMADGRRMVRRCATAAAPLRHRCRAAAPPLPRRCATAAPPPVLCGGSCCACVCHRRSRRKQAPQYQQRPETEHRPKAQPAEPCATARASASSGATCACTSSLATARPSRRHARATAARRATQISSTMAADDATRPLPEGPSSRAPGRAHDHSVPPRPSTALRRLSVPNCAHCTAARSAGARRARLHLCPYRFLRSECAGCRVEVPRVLICACPLSFTIGLLHPWEGRIATSAQSGTRAMLTTRGLAPRSSHAAGCESAAAGTPLAARTLTLGCSVAGSGLLCCFGSFEIFRSLPGTRAARAPVAGEAAHSAAAAAKLCDGPPTRPPSARRCVRCESRGARARAAHYTVALNLPRI
jgi:hypothetical protein